MSQNKKAYFQGGGVNEPTPGEKKYKSDPAIVMQSRFKEPFYRNYDIYEIPGFDHIGPGAGWHHMQNYKNIQEFLKKKREKLKGKYVAEDSWQLDNGERVKLKSKAALRMNIFFDIFKKSENHMMPPKEHNTNIYNWKNSPYQGTPGPKNKDSNNIDFPIDDQIGSGSIIGDYSSYGNAVGIGGQLDEYLPQNDFEGKTPDQLDFGRDYTEDEKEAPFNLDDLTNKYLNSDEIGLFGLPDGIEPNSDLDADKTINIENSNYGTSDIGTQIYEDKWNI